MTLLPRILTAIALVGLLTMAAPQVWTAAQAQTATNLKCKGCVDKKDIGKKAVKMKNLDKKLQKKITENMMGANRRDFYARINNNATRTLLTFGTFVLFARCILNQGGDDRVELGLRSTRNGWFHGPFSSPIFSPFPSSAEVILGTLFAIAGAQAYQVAQQPGGLDATGAILGLIYFGLGLNILGNACVVHGHVDTGTLN